MRRIQRTYYQYPIALYLALTFSIPVASFPQTNIEVRVKSISTDVCDLDGFAEGSSDPLWEATADDMLGNSSNFFREEFNSNGPFTLTINETFFSQSYGNPPSSISLAWRAYENDGAGAGEADTGIISTSININYSQGGDIWHNQLFQQESVAGFCSGEVSWQITFEVRYSIILPVTLIDFNGFSKGNRVELNWQTSSEINNEGFYIEQSPDGNSFKEVGFVPSKHENGNSNSITNYTYSFDAHLATYFRLKQIDFDGRSDYSKIIHIKSSSLPKPKTYPNPFHDSFKISFNSHKIQVIETRIYSFEGLVTSKTIVLSKGNNEITLGQELKGGIYYIHFIPPILKSIKLIKR